jgi:hypothetical protein
MIRFGTPLQTSTKRGKLLMPPPHVVAVSTWPATMAAMMAATIVVDHADGVDSRQSAVVAGDLPPPDRELRAAAAVTAQRQRRHRRR